MHRPPRARVCVYRERMMEGRQRQVRQIYAISGGGIDK